MNTNASTAHNRHLGLQYSAGGVSSGSGAFHNPKTPAPLVSSRGTGSSLRPGGRNNFFFGPDYSTLAGTGHAGRLEQAAAAQVRRPRGGGGQQCDPKAASVLADVGGVPYKARRLLCRGRRREEPVEEEEEEEEGIGPRADVLALQDAEVRQGYYAKHVFLGWSDSYSFWCPLCSVL